MKMHKRWGILGASLLLIAAFQNCSKVQVASESSNAGVGDLGDDDGGNDDPGNPGGGDNGLPSGPQSASVVYDPARKADIVVVIDNSKSMLPESLHLASRMSGFIADLSRLDIDWQMCITTTDITSGGEQGLPVKFSGTSDKVLSKTKHGGLTADQLNSIFSNTVNSVFADGGGDGDERGIAALYKSVEKMSQHSCYRSGAVTATIILSDEDERSYGGSQAVYNASRKQSTFYDLTSIDKPENLLSLMRDSGFSNVIANSIIVDSVACEEENERTPYNGSYYDAYIGTWYKKLSEQTQGIVASICASDYSPNLTSFASRIAEVTHSVQLKCVPVAGSLSVTSSPANASYAWVIDGNRVKVTSSSSSMFTVNVGYRCQ